MQHTKQTLAQALSITVHDLRASIDAVQSYLSVMKDSYYGTVSREQQEVLTRCGARLSEMGNMIGDILAVTQYESGRISMEQVSLGDLLQDSIQLLCGEAKRLGVSLGSGVHPENVSIFGSPSSLRRLMVNLLSNAIRFTPTGGTVRVDLKKEVNQARIEISDTGVGISSKDMPRIFDDFYQGQSIIDGRAGSTSAGMGLYICRRIVESHQGRIWAESPRSDGKQGSVFVVLLPIRDRELMPPQ
jgi:signal transduction histidine kinase